MFKCFVWWTVLIHVSFGGLPSYFPRCYIDDANLNECLVRASDELRPLIKDGVPELGLPAFNPFYVPKIEMKQGSDAINYKVTLSNMTIYGLADYKFSEFRYFPKELVFRGTALFSNMNMTTQFDVEGKLMGMPIRGTGVYTTVLGPSSGSLNITGDLVMKQGVEYYKATNAAVDIKISEYTSQFTGLFDDNQQLKEMFTNLLNDNSKELLEEMMPAINKVTEGIAMNVMGTISNSVPYNELLPTSS